MSAAGSPDSRRAPGPALLAGLALLAAALVVTATLLTSRQPSALPLPARTTGPKASPIRRSVPVPRGQVGKIGRPSTRKAAAAPRRKTAVVVIVERPAQTTRSLPVNDRAAPRTARANPRPMPSEAMGLNSRAPAPPQAAKPLPPPSPEQESGAGAAYSPPEPLFRVEARYPDDAAREDVTGTVRLKVILDRRGRVEDALVIQSSGDDRLDTAAEEAVRQWRYRPARRHRRPVAAVDYATIDFYRDAAGPSEE